MAEDIKITIATTVFNAANTLAATLNSVLNQTYKRIEYVIVDGDSGDGSKEIITDYATRHPETITFISEPDSGIYDAMNKALQLATGDFLIFLGADDSLYNDDVLTKFADMVTNRQFVYYGDVLSSISREVRYGPFTTDKLILQNISHQAIFYPKHVYKSFTYHLKYKFFSDWDYNLRVWSKLGPFQRIDLIVTLFAEMGASHGQDAVFTADRPELVKKYFGNKYAWLIKMQHLKQQLLGKTDLRKIKGYFLPKLK